ncbi:YjiH family protein [Bacillus sp. AGMB 02131]|uniref:YjiH family protein n=1 Tax=Peribacillus faecalis TaxID=2772559 RepID=A0A927CXB9_9BACI|nr:YjiH family protein [Peribacillus faecalis]MBD3107039.1 YjiH family protein [Peribacillus faecalis]
MKSTRNHFTLSSILMFIIPSLIGILLFMTPIKYNGEITIPIAILSGFMQDVLGNSIPYITAVIIVLTAIITVIAKFIELPFLKKSPFFMSLFDVHAAWVVIRVLGAIFAVCTIFQIGPEWIWSADTGGMLLFNLLAVLFSVFFFAGLLLPLLLNYGLLELFGAVFTKVMRPLFKLPGSASVGCATSWLGDGTIGVLLTSKQYEEGIYTKREAAIIGTTFSVVSITFSLVIISQVGLSHMFIPFYLTVLLAGVAAAIIMPRIPPLSRKPDEYYRENPDKQQEIIPEGYTPFSWGFSQAVERASKNQGMKQFFIDGGRNVLDMWMGVAPVVMAMGTLAVIIANYTPLFQWLGIPFVPILELLNVPEAHAASETILIGFADMFLPSVLAAGIESELTRFVIACLSVTQLIYMSEVGGLLLGSKIPVKFKDLVAIFLLRTVITLPIIVLVAHLIF